MLELKEISEEEYYTLMDRHKVFQGVVLDEYNGNVIAFTYVYEGIYVFYKVV